MADPAEDRPPWPWTSPEATRRGLSQLIRNRYPSVERQLRVQEIAFRRLLARLYACHPAGWVVKGGVALGGRQRRGRDEREEVLPALAEAR